MKSLSSAKVVGEAHGTSDQIHEFQEDEITLFVAVSTATQGISTPVDLLLTIRSIAKSLWEDFLKRRSMQEGLYESLKASVIDANKHFGSNQVALDIGGVLTTPDAVYYVMTAGLDVFLVRETPIKLTRNESGIRGGSGTLKEGDIFVLVARSLQQLLLEQNFDRTFDDISDDLRAQVSTAQLPGVALLLHIPSDKPTFKENTGEDIFEEPADPISNEVNHPTEEIKPVTSHISPLSRIGLVRPARPRIFVPKSEYDLSVRVRSRKASIMGAILVVFLFISIALGIRQNNSKQKEHAFSEKVSSVRTILDEAQKSGSLNRVRTRELLTEAQAQIESFTETEKESSQYKDLSNEIKTDFSSLTGLYQSSAENFLDLTLQSADFKGSSVSFADGVIYVLDSTRNRVVSVEIASKRTQTVGNSDSLGSIKRIAAYSDRVFAVTADGLYELTARSTKVLGSEWSDNNLFALFASNLYVLSQGDNMIYRYSGQTSGFGEKATWIAPNVEVHIDSAISWAIDGTIWVLTNTGKLIRFTQGLPQTVNISGVSADLTHATKLVTTEELTHLYILDPENKRVVVLDKKGAFVAEYVADEVEDAKDLVVSEEQGKIILLTDSKLMSISLSSSE